MRQGIQVALVLILLFSGCLDEETDNLDIIADDSEVNEMVFGFMFTGIVENTCGDLCTFEAEQ